MNQPILTRRDALRTRRSRPSSLTIPASCHPHVRLMFEEMRRRQLTYDIVAEGAGVQRPAMKSWRHRSIPSLASIEAVLGFLNFDLVPVPRSRILDPNLVAALTPIADQFSMSMPATVAAMSSIVVGIHARAANLASSPAPRTAPSLGDLTPAPSG